MSDNDARELTHQLPATLPSDLPVQELMRQLAENQDRTDQIVAEALAAWQEGRNVLLLSERTDHITTIASALAPEVNKLFVLHGRLGQRKRSATLAALEALPPNAPRIVVATGRLVGEGFDHPPLDTLLLAMPVSWRGTLQQYAGRLHRQQAGKTSVRIIDWLDLGRQIPQRMWEKRLRGSRAMGYALQSRSASHHQIGVAELLEQRPRGAHPLHISKALGVDQQVGVECCAHQS